MTATNVSPYTNSIFQQPWWLDAVAPNQWKTIEIKHGDKIVARWPYVILQGRSGIKKSFMPPLTQTLGPWMTPSQGKYATQLAYQKELSLALIQQLPHFPYFSQNFHHSITNWLPFYWSSFSQTTRYSYILDDLTNTDRIWHEFDKDARTEIRKAQKQLTVRTDLGLDCALDVISLTFLRQGMKLPYSSDLVRRLDKACEAHQGRRMFFAQDAQGKVHAVLYLIWDERSAYYLMGGANTELRSSGAMSLLIWSAIQFAASVSQSFDFEGSMIEPIETFFRQFGARQVPYFQITQVNSRLLRLVAAVQALRR